MNARIFLENPDNSVIGIYVHTINENVKNILKNVYNTKEKVQTLINKGPILSLDESNILAIEDNGIFFQEAFRNADVSRNAQIDRTYVFSSDTWMVSENGSNFSPL